MPRRHVGRYLRATARRVDSKTQSITVDFVDTPPGESPTKTLYYDTLVVTVRFTWDMSSFTRDKTCPGLAARGGAAVLSALSCNVSLERTGASAAWWRAGRVQSEHGRDDWRVRELPAAQDARWCGVVSSHLSVLSLSAISGAPRRLGQPAPPLGAESWPFGVAECLPCAHARTRLAISAAHARSKTPKFARRG